MNDRIYNFYDLSAWKKSHELVLEIYIITKTFPKEELFGITSQLRRAASSIGANIAEGFSRYHFNDKKKFYYHARGSASEVHSFLLLAIDLKYLDLNVYKKLEDIINNVTMLINGLIRSIENQQLTNY